MSVWTTKSLPGSDLRPAPQDLDKVIVLLLYGKNSFGDRIYSYLKITIAGLEQLKDAAIQGNNFTPSDFGTIIAAGRGEPTDEVRSEISTMYQIFDAQQTVKAAAPAVDPKKKAWDEY